ncbi:putative 2-aminoethylphosphonate ABC transporter ATP-binding protein [Marinomonas mediterranea]|jgi:putative 2-aminoethylphosphonate ABC transporter, ATP-binding protein|uniref:2-aminoethylphosphonate ABC transport system, ATP-binding protein component n=1 Tax=Marinomonas mediterranea (strain ATCC 700492 / JCM 21426 / NBRC 103028 / MMB-1) TaxID=717774 RepID=F2JXY4_MARM1|nr:putative 2-aminoethylphosphonate ABC transporter ATP-binding protein [Marinomonas mediterranea]ADZ89633.1 2-aminoethylphosphonate ABC transport system, ATP-binding protein component [Marinomonas mediterranea MMB-1]WCN07724.1 putative 2-aminoethylphosphonate ABC transporter ATP-binding protein [Marinomonas mediterranea]WCN11825.1 putative 2-aminoethylphosphonate ABC transporter ATP-binding protein [Marinomonas mediterranea]WCN15873.1 putative 2-aminoethylphosphonate ABC transporter ATP-bindin
MSSTYLALNNIHQKFGTHLALNDVSLDVAEGEFVCFLGPSGCGKTSLLRIIAGLDLPTGGQVNQAGKDITYAPVKHRDFGIVFQSYALFPNLTVEDNIAYGLVTQNVSAQERRNRVKELLATVGLSGSERKYPAQLSGGQQQRVALARALATSPGLLLLDEPLSALDARVRAHLRQEIKQLQEKLGVTTIMVTHDQEEALTMADKIVVMNHGIIEQIGSPQTVYSQPKSAFVASFVGEMNFLQADIAGDHLLKSGDHTIEFDGQLGQKKNAIQVAIRPEDVRFLAQGQDQNTFTGRVAHTEFLGSRVRSTLKLDGIEAPLLADVSMNEMATLNIEAGHSVICQLPKDRLHVFEGV